MYSTQKFILILNPGLFHSKKEDKIETVIRVQSERQIIKQNFIEVETETRYYIASFTATADTFAQKIRSYW
ncbi:MAG: hypothetical protein ACKO3K_10645, partial [Cuspidothrix sp.]